MAGRANPGPPGDDGVSWGWRQLEGGDTAGLVLRGDERRGAT